jgi:hypothetical protein
MIESYRGRELLVFDRPASSIFARHLQEIYSGEAVFSRKNCARRCHIQMKAFAFSQGLLCL